MRKLLLVLLLLPFCGFAQIKNCATDILQERLRLAKPDRAVKEIQFNNNVYQAVANNSVKRGGDITIPVVVHIIHQNGNENISDALVINGIDHLNQAFSNTGSFYDTDGVDTHIRFCLAQQDEYGNPSNGITRVFSPLTNMISETQDEALKNLVHWDPLQYLNIYLVNEISSLSMGAGVAGYAFFPSSHGMPEDGIVNEARWFGSSVDNSKIHIHEAGHYLGLYHTFNGGCSNNNCLFDGDKVCDTPPDVSTAAVNCGEAVNTCTSDSDDNSTLNPFRPVALGGLGDQPDMFVNYMDYGFQNCQHLLTAGQSERMNAALTTERASLLLSAGCDNSCLVYAFFSGLPDVTINAGIPYPLDGIPSGGTGYTFSWLVNGIEVATTEDYNFTAPHAGNYSVTFRVFNPALNCFKEKTFDVNAICGTQLAAVTLNPANPLPGESVLFTGSFAPGTISVQWQIDGTPEALGGSYFNHTFQSAGEYYVSFISTNGNCSDTSKVYVPVGQCNGGEALTWRFGAGNTLTFYGDDPIQGVLPATLYNQEGIGNICDVNGNLLLYSDGIRAFNGQGIEYQNDSLLTGGASSSQAALIVPNPSNDNLYYIFTTGDSGSGEMHYATADVSQNKILSDVQLVTQVTEKLAAVKHCNGHDTWVVGKKFFSSAFYAFLVTDTGVIETPVISYAGTEQNYSAIGCMKFSPEGNKLALAVMEDASLSGYVELMDFDNATGNVSISLIFQSPAFTAPYGIEFSPDGSKLYIGNGVPYPHANIYQYDLSSVNAPEILASGQLVASSTAGVYGLGSLQLAKNGKIYVARSGSSFLDEISNPDLAGTACGFVDKAISGLFNNFGLPNFVVNSVASNIPYISGPSQVCANSTANYSIACGYEGTTSWNYSGPGTMQTIDATHATIQSGTINGAGRLIASRDAGCYGILRDTFLLQIGSPIISLGADTVICSSGQVHLSPGAGYTSYLWNDGTTMSYLNAQGAGTYSVQVTGAGGCTATSSIQVDSFDQEFDFSLGADKTLCTNYMATVTIQPLQGNFSAYEWSTGQTTPTLIVGLTGTYSLTVTNEDGCIARDTIVVTYREEAEAFEFAEPATICPGGVLILNTGYPDLVTEWQDHSDLPTYTAWQPGLYWATISNGCNATSFTDSIEVTSLPSPVVNFGSDTVVCPFVPFTLIAGTTNGNTYLWNDGTQLSTHSVDGDGVYSVTVTNAFGCETRESIEVMTCPTGIDQLNKEVVFIYPNPAFDSFRIYSKLTGNTVISIYNSAGALVYSKVMNFDKGLAEISTGNMAAGIYTVRLVSERKSLAKKLVIER